MAGRASDDPHRSYPGDRPSTTILLDRLDPATLGALIAFYEHRTFANAALLGINPFDQFGVELGKEMAKAMEERGGDRTSILRPRPDRPRLRGGGLMKGTLLIVALALATPAAAEPLELFNNRPFVAITINGRPATALLDSAAEMTMLDDDFAARLGLAATDSATAHGSGADAMEARFAEHVAISAAGTSSTSAWRSLIWARCPRACSGAMSTCCSAANCSTRRGCGSTIGQGRSSNSKASRAACAWPFGEHRGIPTFPASVEGQAPVDAVFDTGNGSQVLIGQAYAERIGLTAPDRIVERDSGGGLGGARRRDIVILRELSVAGRSFRDVRAAIDPGATASDLNLGTSILRHFRIVTDFPNRSIWLEPLE